jgi:hypothetical protein
MVEKRNIIREEIKMKRPVLNLTDTRVQGLLVSLCCFPVIKLIGIIGIAHKQLPSPIYLFILLFSIACNDIRAVFAEQIGQW